MGNIWHLVFETWPFWYYLKEASLWLISIHVHEGGKKKKSGVERMKYIGANWHHLSLDSISAKRDLRLHWHSQISLNATYGISKISWKIQFSGFLFNNMGHCQWWENAKPISILRFQNLIYSKSNFIIFPKNRCY